MYIDLEKRESSCYDVTADTIPYSEPLICVYNIYKCLCIIHIYIYIYIDLENRWSPGCDTTADIIPASKPLICVYNIYINVCVYHIYIYTYKYI